MVLENGGVKYDAGSGIVKTFTISPHSRLAVESSTSAGMRKEKKKADKGIMGRLWGQEKIKGKK